MSKYVGVVNQIQVLLPLPARACFFVCVRVNPYIICAGESSRLALLVPWSSVRRVFLFRFSLVTGVFLETHEAEIFVSAFCARYNFSAYLNCVCTEVLRRELLAGWLVLVDGDGSLASVGDCGVLDVGCM